MIYDNDGAGMGSDSISLASGANESQTNPVITSVINNGFNTLASETLDASSLTTYRLEFFANSSPCLIGTGEGERFLGTENLDSFFGNSFSVTLPHVPEGGFVSATATKISSGIFFPESHNDTSEMSPCVPVVLFSDGDNDGIPDQW